MRLRCRIGKHEWLPWFIDTHQVQLQRIVNAVDTPSKFITEVLGYEYEKCLPPAWRGCRHCSAAERKLPGE